MPGNTKLAVAAVRLTPRVQSPRKREKNQNFAVVCLEVATVIGIVLRTEVETCVRLSARVAQKGLSISGLDNILSRDWASRAAELPAWWRCHVPTSPKGWGSVSFWNSLDGGERT